MADPRVWGTHLWATMHRLSLSYPQFDPKPEQRKAARDFFRSIKEMLPCVSCRHHYGEHFDKTFDESTLDSRVALARWVYDLHESVNKRLGKPTGVVAFEQLPELYNSFPLRYVSLDGRKLLREPRFSTLDNDYGGCDVKIELNDKLQQALRANDDSLGSEAQQAALAVAKERTAQRQRATTMRAIATAGAILLSLLVTAAIAFAIVRSTRRRQVTDRQNTFPVKSNESSLLATGDSIGDR